MRSARGQASIDYVAILAVVAVILGSAAAVAAGVPWLAPRAASEIRHGICVVSGALCTADEAREAGLAPCPIHRRSDAERLGAVAVVQLARGDALLVERRSDDSPSVSFVDGWEAGVQAGVGVTLPGATGSLTAGAGVRFAAGRTFEFGAWSTARRFLARFAREETLTGEGRRVLRGLCWHCPEWLEGRGRALPAPSARYDEGGSFVDFAAELGAEVPAGAGRGPVAVGLKASGGRAVVLGRRTSGRRVTWYLRLQAQVVSELGAVMGSLGSEREAEGVLEITTDGGTPVLARVVAAAAVTGDAEVVGLHAGLAGVTDRLRGLTAPRPREDGPTGVAVEAAIGLDLRNPANLRAVAGLLHPGLSPLGWVERVRAVARRLDVAGAVDLDVFRATSARTDHSLGGGELIRLGGSYGRVLETRDLVADVVDRSRGCRPPPRGLRARRTGRRLRRR